MLAKEMKKELVKTFSFGKYQLAENVFQALNASVTKGFYNEVKNYLKNPRKISPEILKKKAGKAGGYFRVCFRLQKNYVRIHSIAHGR